MLLLSVAGRITIFLFMFSVFIALLYVQGNFQNFLEESLLGLLAVYRFTALIYFAAAVPYIFILLSMGRRAKRNVSLRVFLTTAGIAVTVVGYLSASLTAAALQPV